MSNTYYEIKALFEGETEVLYGSYSKAEAQYELQAERESWKDSGYTQIKIVARCTDELPDADVYADDDDVDLTDSLQAEIDALQARKVQTGGHGRRARIQARIDALIEKRDAEAARVAALADDDADDDDDSDELSLSGFDDIDHLVSFLTGTLIPDLREAGSEATADDFEDCVRAIEHLQANQRPAPVDSEAVLRTVILRGRPEVC